ncbi:MAG: hypothetical protein AAGB19_09310 [Cyanobacteria bacterium P01_F01_bin.3]
MTDENIPIGDLPKHAPLGHTVTDRGIVFLFRSPEEARIVYEEAISKDNACELHEDRVIMLISDKERPQQP